MAKAVLGSGRGTARPIRMASFVGGEASIFPIGSMPSKYSLRLQNCYFTQTGDVGKMPGYVRQHEVGVGHSVNSGHEFKKRDGTIYKLSAGGGNIYSVSNGATTLIKSGLDPGAKVTFATFQDICIMCNGVDAPLKFDGTNVSTLGGTPPTTAFKVHVHKNRVWFLEKNNKLQPTYSALRNPEDYTTAKDAGYLDLSTVLSTGDELLDIATYIDMLIFFLRNHIIIYSGNNPNSDGDFNLVQVISGCGVVAEGTVQGLGTDIAFLYDSGLKNLRQVVTTGNLTQGELSQAIAPDLVAETAASLDGNFASAHYPALGWYLLMVNGKVRVFSYNYKAWSQMIGADVQGMFNGTDGKIYLLGAKGFLYQYGSTWTFDGALPYMLWETAWISATAGGNKFFPKIAEILCKPGAITTVNLDISFDSNPGLIKTRSFVTPGFSGLMDTPVPDTWDNCFMMDGAKYAPVRVPLGGGGRAMKLSFSNVSDKGVAISDIVLPAAIGRL